MARAVRPGGAGALPRRAFLRGVAAGALGAALGLLAACGREPAQPPAAGGAQHASSSAAASGASSVASTASSVTARTASTAAGSGAKGLVIAQPADVSSLDPHMSTAPGDLAVTLNLFDTLVTRRGDLGLHPGLATAWKLVNDTTWEFTLRRGVSFHDGSPFTARDVVFSIERTRDPAAKTLVATVFATVGAVEALDDFTVRFTTRRPDPLLPNRLATYGGQILPAGAFQQAGAEGFAQKPVGTGPVKLVAWRRDDHLTLARNDSYWGGPIAFKTVTWKPIADVAARIAALKKGEAHIVTRLTPEHWDEVSKGQQNVHGEAVPYTGLYVLGVNSTVPGLSNKLVKQALSAAIDRAAIIKDLFHDLGMVPNGPIAQGQLGYDPNLPPYAYEPDRARALLKQAGYSGEPIVIETTGAYVPGEKQMTESIAGMWKEVGVSCKVEVIEYAQRMERYRARSFKGLWWGDPSDTLGDPDSTLWRLLGPGGPYDFWRDAEFDRAGDDQHTATDRSRRLEDFKVMVRVFNDSLPWLPVLQPYDLYGVANGVDWKPYGNQQFELRRFNLRDGG